MGGSLADRFGPKRVIAATLVAAVPFLMAAPFLEGAWFAIVLAIGGFFLQSTQPLNVAYGQAVAPVSAATVSSLMMGVAWGTGGLMVPLIGTMADRLGIEATLSVLSVLPAAAALCVVPLPALPGRHVVTRRGSRHQRTGVGQDALENGPASRGSRRRSRRACGTIASVVPRSPYSSRNVIYSFGPSLTPAVKFLIYANVAVFILEWIAPAVDRLRRA